MIRNTLASLVVTLALVSPVGCGGAGMPTSQPHPLLQQSPSAFEEPSLAGDMVSFPKKGAVTVVDFWSTSCKPCVKMLPEIEALYVARRTEGLAVVGVAIDDNPGLVGSRLKELGVTYPNLLDDAASTMRGTYQVDELPQTFVFDRQGQVRLVTTGGDGNDVTTIRDAVDALLAE